MFKFKILLLLFVPLLINAQTTGEFRVLTQPQSAIIKLGDKVLEYNKFYDIDTGVYIIKAWDEKRALLERQIHIKDSIPLTVRMQLEYSDEYKAYKFKTKKYYVSKNLLRYGPGVSYLIYVLNSMSTINKFKEDANRFESEVEFFQDRYEKVFWPSDFKLIEANYNQSLLNYNEAVEVINRRYRNMQIGAVGAVVGTYIGWKIAKRLKKPVYKETPLLSNVIIVPNFINSVGFTLATKF